MARNPNNNPLSTVERIKRGGVATLAALGILSLGACADEVKAEKPPVTATASPTPGETTPPDTTSAPTESAPETSDSTETTSPDAPETSEPTETTPPQSEALNGIDFNTSDIGPAGEERAKELTPEAVSGMIVSGNFEPFEIHLSDIDPEVYGGTAAENYLDVASVNLASIFTSGYTLEDMEVAMSPELVSLSTRDFNLQALVVPALTASFGETGAVNSPASQYSFGQRAFDVNRAVISAHESAVVDDLEYPEDLDTAMGQIEGNPAAETMPYYSLATSIKDKAVSYDGTGGSGDAISGSFTIEFEETTPFTDEQISIMTQYIDINPDLYKSVKGSINVTIEGAVDDSDGDRVTANTVYTEMASNQNPDGTVNE